jgi:outer membrane protein
MIKKIVMTCSLLAAAAGVCAQPLANPAGASTQPLIIDPAGAATQLPADTAAAFAQSPADVQARRWLVRLRQIHLQSANKDTTGIYLSIQNRWITAGDISYFFTPNLAVEASIFGLPDKFYVKTLLGLPIGTITALPPMVTAQYHFTDLGKFKPYLGLGLNYTRILSTNLVGGISDISRHSFGGVVQAGVDYELEKNIYLNLDAKKSWIRNTVYLGKTKIGMFKMDPTLVAVGIGYRF